MIIDSISVKNLRCLRELHLQLGPLTALLGRNGVGKSSILHALAVFYDTAAPISRQDFYNVSTGDPIEITIVFGHLHPAALEQFRPFVSADLLAVTKRIRFEGDHITQRYFGSVLQLPAFAAIRTIAALRDRITAWNDLVASEDIQGLKRARSSAEVEANMGEYEASHPELLSAFEAEHQFFGPSPIGTENLNAHTRFLLIPAVRDVADELSQGRGSLSQLLDLIVHRQIEAREDIVRRRGEIQELVRELYRPDNLPELPRLGEDISRLLDRFSPGSGLILDWEEPPVTELPLPSARPRLLEDDFEGDIDKKGHGLQRALLMTLLQYLAQLTAQPPKEQAGLEAPRAARPGTGLVLGIEEPELYLHPLRARHLSDLFTELTLLAPDGITPRNQIIFSSHSPQFVDLRRFETIRILRKDRHTDDPLPRSLVSSLPLANAVRELARVAKLPEDQITEASFKAHLIPVMGSASNEGFFADAIVLVEGLGDAGIISGLQQVMSMNWTARGIAIIPVDGKTKLDRHVIVFSGLGIPTYTVFDGDRQLRGSGEEKSAVAANRLLLRLFGAGEVDFPPSQVTPRWAVFERDIENEISVAISQPVFEQLCRRIASEYGFDPSSRALKSPICSSAFITRAYEEGHRIRVLERVVEAASSLIP